MAHISITSEVLFNLFGLPVTNTLLTSWIVTTFLIFLLIFIKKTLKVLPDRLQNIAELALEKLLDFFASVSGSEEKARKFLPLVGTVFIFILTANWIGILPIFGSIGLKHGDEFIPLFRSINSDLNMTLTLAIIVVVLAHIFGIFSIGLKNHLAKFLNFSSPTNFFIGILETIGEISRVISFSFRLFGNVFAGEVLLTIIGILIPYIAPIPFLGMELFVGFIQALIFATLSMLIISTFTEKHQTH